MEAVAGDASTRTGRRFVEDVLKPLGSVIGVIDRLDMGCRWVMAPLCAQDKLLLSCSASACPDLLSIATPIGVRVCWRVPLRQHGRAVESSRPETGVSQEAAISKQSSESGGEEERGAAAGQ